MGATHGKVCMLLYFVKSKNGSKSRNWALENGSESVTDIVRKVRYPCSSKSYLGWQDTIH